MAQQTDHIGDTNKMVTAVEWLLIWFDNNNYYISSEIAQAFNKAKQMEKEQIINAWRNGDNDSMYDFKELDELANEYYNETYGSNNQI